jgi:hypothetical protein
MPRPGSGDNSNQAMDGLVEVVRHAAEALPSETAAVPQRLAFQAGERPTSTKKTGLVSQGVTEEPGEFSN